MPGRPVGTPHRGRGGNSGASRPAGVLNAAADCLARVITDAPSRGCGNPFFLAIGNACTAVRCSPPALAVFGAACHSKDGSSTDKIAVFSAFLCPSPARLPLCAVRDSAFRPAHRSSFFLPDLQSAVLGLQLPEDTGQPFSGDFPVSTRATCPSEVLFCGSTGWVSPR